MGQGLVPFPQPRLWPIGTNWAGTTPSPPTRNGSLTDMAQETTGWTRDDMAARAAKEMEAGFYVNLGIGLPAPVVPPVPTGMTVTPQSENGMPGIDMGSAACRAEVLLRGKI